MVAKSFKLAQRIHSGPLNIFSDLVIPVFVACVYLSLAAVRSWSMQVSGQRSSADARWRDGGLKSVGWGSLIYCCLDALLLRPSSCCFLRLHLTMTHFGFTFRLACWGWLELSLSCLLHLCHLLSKLRRLPPVSFGLGHSHMSGFIFIGQPILSKFLLFYSVGGKTFWSYSNVSLSCDRVIAIYLPIAINPV